MIDRERIVNILANRVMALDEYNEYLRTRDALKEDPELYKRVCDYQEANYKFQRQHGDIKSDQVAELMRMTEEFSHNKLAEDYLQAELGFCRLMQNIVRGVVDKLDFEIGFNI